MLLGIAGHTVDKGGLDPFEACAVERESLIEEIDLRLKVGGMLVVKLRILLNGRKFRPRSAYSVSSFEKPLQII